jgi:hypothetical protein
MNPRYPVYIISKGRWNRRPTASILKKMGVPFFIVVEEQEYENYCAVIDKSKVLILPKSYQENYDTFWKDNDGRVGAGAPRNFCWDDSIKRGYKWHWVLDDNIESVERFNNNMKVRCMDGTPFYVIEDFVLRYENIAQAGMGYAIFCPSNERRPALRFNTRIYSCLLIRNDIPYRWRGRYNEDTDLSLRVMKDGWCTVEFNAFLIGKRATQTMGGGNTAEFYKDEGTLKKSKMLVEMHPDVAKLTKKFNRWHHHVDYRPFKKNKLIRKPEIKTQKGVNNFNMKLIKI